MRIVTASCFSLAVYLLANVTPVVAQASTGSQPVNQDFSCSGEVHAQAIALWESALRDFTYKRINDGLIRDGDAYVLYYTQTNLQAFVEMTRRCKDRHQISELVDALNPAFSALRPLPGAPTTHGWVCTGGRTCTSVNHLLGKEVPLCSAQFLGLLGAVATSVIETIPEARRTDAEKAFVVNTATAVATQMDNWLSPSYFKDVLARTDMTPADAKDRQSKYFFRDRDLWFMTSLADLAELHQADIKPSDSGAKAFKSLQTKHEKIADLFNLFLARVTLSDTPKGKRAEIDRGYWRNYADSKYAGYHADISPVACQKDRRGLMKKTFRVESDASYIDPNLGWDFSHARRLVPALDTFVRNQSGLATVFGYRNTKFDPVELQRAFANQIVEKVWNKDKQYPLFSNFWDGSNGWYRAGYENGTGGCRPGQAPYSLTRSFATGGYPQWGSFNSAIQSMSQQLYTLSKTTNPKAKAFVNKYYDGLQQPLTSVAATNHSHSAQRLAFLASLVGN